MISERGGGNMIFNVIYRPLGLKWLKETMPNKKPLY